jgi:hypothetical protein
MVPHDTGSPPDRATGGGYSSIPTHWGSRQSEPPLLATPCPQREPCHTAGSPPSDQSSRPPVGTTAPSRPNWVRDNQSHPAVRRRVVHLAIDNLMGPCFLPPDHHRASPWGLQLHPDPCGFATIRATPPCDAELSIGTLCRVDDSSFLYPCVSSIPWFHHRATRGDYSPNAAPARVTEPPRRATPSGDQRRK